MILSYDWTIGGVLPCSAVYFHTLQFEKFCYCRFITHLLSKAVFSLCKINSHSHTQNFWFFCGSIMRSPERRCKVKIHLMCLILWSSGRKSLSSTCILLILQWCLTTYAIYPEEGIRFFTLKGLILLLSLLWCEKNHRLHVEIIYTNEQQCHGTDARILVLFRKQLLSELSLTWELSWVWIAQIPTVVKNMILLKISV